LLRASAGPVIPKRRNDPKGLQGDVMVIANMVIVMLCFVVYVILTWINRLGVLSCYLLSKGVDNTFVYYYHVVVGGETRVGVHYLQDAGGWIMTIFLALLRCLLKWLVDNTFFSYYHGVVGGETRVGVHYMQDAGGWIMNIFLALLCCLLKWLLIGVNWASEYTFG
jgi:hypothetical protein